MITRLPLKSTQRSPIRSSVPQSQRGLYRHNLPLYCTGENHQAQEQDTGVLFSHPIEIRTWQSGAGGRTSGLYPDRRGGNRPAQGAFAVRRGKRDRQGGGCVQKVERDAGAPPWGADTAFRRTASSGEGKSRTA